MNTMENENEICYTFYEHGGVISKRITRKLLLETSLGIAKELQTRGIKKGDCVIIFSTQTSDNIYSVMGAMLAGAIFTLIPLPVDEGKRMRFESVVHSCEPKFILCDQEKLNQLPNQQFSIPVIDCTQCYEHEGFTPVKLELDDLIYIQYTSGSTSAPKGIMVSYGNLISAVNLSPRSTELKRIFGWVPFFHNLGLIFLVFMPALMKHVSVGIISQTLFLEHPEEWLLGLHNFKADCTLAPNSAYDLYPRLVPASKLKGIDLSRIEALLNGSEMVKNSTMERFSKEYESLGLQQNCFCVGYGLSETTCGVAAQLNYTAEDTMDIEFDSYRSGKLVLAEKQDSETIQFVSNGTKMHDTVVKIVNPATLDVCEENQFGEIWVQSPNVTQGYYKNEKATRECYHWKLKGYDGEFLRTGDMGIMQDENLYVTGRIKELIIINGNNILPNDIITKLEETVEETRDFTMIPFSVMDEAKERLILVLGVKDAKIPEIHFDFLDQISENLLRYFDVTPYEIVIVRNSMLPHTDSGKLSTHKVVELYQDHKLVDIRPNSTSGMRQAASEIQYATSTQKALSTFISKTFHVKALPTENILNYGMDSLQVMEFTAYIEDYFSISIPVSYIFENPSIEKIGEYIDRAAAGEDLSILEKDKRFLYDEVQLDQKI